MRTVYRDPLLRHYQRSSYALLAIGLLLLLGACGGESEQLQPLDSDAVILAFGDSLTHGTGAGEKYSYPMQLAEQTGLRVINAGVTGELSARGRERLPALLEKHQPDLLILCHAGNDILRKRDHVSAAENLRAMIEMARAQGSEVLLLAVPEPGLFPAAAAFYEEVATATGTPLLRDTLADILARPALKADVVHPNRAGYTELTRAIILKLQQSGAL